MASRGARPAARWAATTRTPRQRPRTPRATPVRAQRPARHRAGADPHVPRDRLAPSRRAVSGAVRDGGAVRAADARARRGRLPRGDDEPDVGQLAPRHAAAGRQADRDQLRQRLRVAVPLRASGAALDELGRRREPPAERTASGAGRALAARGARPRPRRLGARHAGLQPRRPDHARRERAALPGRGRADDDPRPLPRRGALVLLPVGSLQRDGDRGGQSRGLPRLDDGRAGVGEPARGPLPAAAARGPRRYRAGVAAQRHRRLPRRPAPGPSYPSGSTPAAERVPALAAARSRSGWLR